MVTLQDKLLHLASKEEEGSVTEEERDEIKTTAKMLDSLELFAEKFGSQHEEMSLKVEYASMEFKQLMERTETLMKKFAFDTTKNEPKEMFEALSNFAKEFTKSFEKLKQRQEAEESRLKRLRLKKQMSDKSGMVVEEQTLSAAELREKLKKVE